jgi:inosine-uridine nucleoside N-ribohydrolase
MGSFSKVPDVWVDADFSGLVWSGLDCDDDLALLALLAQQGQTLNLVGISVCGGNAPLSHTWANMKALWNFIRFDGEPSLAALQNRIVPKRGYGWRSMQVSRRWMNWLHLIAPDAHDSEEATNAIVDYALQKYEKRSKDFQILTLGPPTNVARAIEKLEQLSQGGQNILRDSIKHVFMMGGELTGSRLDLNFLSDRGAARSIIENESVEVTLISIQLCGQVVVDDAFIKNLEKRCCGHSDGSVNSAVCAILPKMKQQVYFMPRYINPAVEQKFPKGGPWRQSPNIKRGFIPWDVLAVLVMTHPELFAKFDYHRVAFPSCSEGEPCDKTMTVLANMGQQTDDPSRNQSGIVRIPHIVVNESIVLETIHKLLCQVPSMEGPQPKLMLGFFGQFLGMLIFSIGTLLALWLSRKETRQQVIPTKKED